MKKGIVLISAIVIATVVIVGVIFLVRSQVNPATIELEVNPSPPLNIKQGENLTLEIAIRNSPGFKSAAEGVEGELTLPDGFVEESLQTQTRQLIFGRIDAGESGQYTLTIAASNTVEFGQYYAELAIWGTNIPRQEVNIEIIVNP